MTTPPCGCRVTGTLIVRGADEWIGAKGARIEYCATHAAAFTLREALEPFAAFARKWDAKPIRGLSNDLYGIHGGTEWEAYLKLSDCRKADAALRAAGGGTT